ncbi:MAG: NADH-quinone oxidoreductase subunit J [Puniceicoccaceae bacterium]|nr:MAG: NADH-quinone oxidoreductase subunit J [Puniceicoccaceae bacterium]
MVDFFFYLFSAFTLACGLLVVLSRNPVNAAVFLILTLLGVASLFVMLQAYLLAAVQVLVYAGAVVVLFLFIIMLLDVPESARKRFKPAVALAAGLSGLVLILGVGLLVSGAETAGPEAPAAGVGADLKAYGEYLFTSYLLPLQVTGFLLLIAMIGVILLSRKPSAAADKEPAEAKTR